MGDFNRDGDWDDVHVCTLPDGTQINVPEHIVADQDLSTLPLGVNTVTSLPFYSWHPNTTTTDNPEPPLPEPLHCDSASVNRTQIGSGLVAAAPAVGCQQ